MRIDLLCSGSKGNSCLIRSDHAQILIDCGSTKKYLTKAFDQVDADVNVCDGVLITHTHKDHVSRIKDVAHLPVYSYCDIDDLSNHHIVCPNETFDVGDFHIRVIRLSHDAPKTVGYVIETQTQKLVYITDTDFVPNEVKEYLQDADYYIFESNHDVAKLMQTSRPMFIKQRILGDDGHLNNEDSSHNLMQLINSRTKEIILAHISQEANHPQLALDVLEDAFRKQGFTHAGMRLRAAHQFDVCTIQEVLY